MPTIDENRKLNGLWASKLEDGIERSTSCSACEQNVVNEDDMLPCGIEVWRWIVRLHRDGTLVVVSIGRYVQRLCTERAFVYRIHLVNQRLGQRETALQNAKHPQVLASLIALHNFVRQTAERALHTCR